MLTLEADHAPRPDATAHDVVFAPAVPALSSRKGGASRSHRPRDGLAGRRRANSPVDRFSCVDRKNNSIVEVPGCE
jgi:hypothetical protein